MFFANDSGAAVVAGEWFPDSLERIEGPDNLVRITGPGIASVMQDARVEFYDWDGSAQFTSTFPDWVWGGPNVLFNPGFEDGIGGNDTFELSVGATGGTFTLTAAAQTTGALDWDETNTNIEFALQALSTVNDVTVSGTGQPGVYQLYNGATGGTFDIDINGGVTTIAYNASAAVFEAALTGVGVTGSGTVGDPWILTFWGYGNLLEVAVDDTNLTGGTSTLSLDTSPDSYVITFFSPNDIGTFTVDDTNLTGGDASAAVIQTGTAEQQTGNWTVQQGADQVIEPRVHGSATIASGHHPCRHGHVFVADRRRLPVGRRPAGRLRHPRRLVPGVPAHPLDQYRAVPVRHPRPVREPDRRLPVRRVRVHGDGEHVDDRHDRRRAHPRRCRRCHLPHRICGDGHTNLLH